MATPEMVDSDYLNIYPQILEVSDRLEKHLKATVQYERIDQIVVRAKGLESFSVKARKGIESGKPKYLHPISDIHDQIGARIVCYYLSDVRAIERQLSKWFRHIERLDKSKERGEKEFGYEGVHYIFALPDEVFASDNQKRQLPKVFELQIKTLFQHAWAQAEHDITYKSVGSWTLREKRQIAFSAAQSWGADQVFEQMNRKLTKRREPS